MIKDGSDKFIKKNVKGLERYDKKNDMKRAKPSKGKLTSNTDDTLARYPQSYASEAASPNVKTKDQNLDLDVSKKKKEYYNNATTRGIKLKK